MENNCIFFSIFYCERSELLDLSAGCINLGWSVSKTVHCRVLNLPGDKKRKREPGETGISLVTQDAAHQGFCWTFPLYRPSRSLEQFRTQSFLLYKSVLVRALNFHRDKKNVGENRGEMENSLVTQDSTHRGFC